MTTLPPEMVAVIPDLERRTGLCISDILKAGFVKVYKETTSTGRLVLEPMPELTA